LLAQNPEMAFCSSTKAGSRALANIDTAVLLFLILRRQNDFLARRSSGRRHS
jgi:hypothetical protein